MIDYKSICSSIIRSVMTSEVHHFSEVSVLLIRYLNFRYFYSSFVNEVHPAWFLLYPQCSKSITVCAVECLSTVSKILTSYMLVLFFVQLFRLTVFYGKRGPNSPFLISSFPSSIKSEVISLSPINCWNPKRFKQRVPKLVKQKKQQFPLLIYN